MNLSRKEYFFLAALLCASFLLNIINNRYQLSGDERASLSSAAGAGITRNRFEDNKSFRSTQAPALEKNIFTQQDYNQRNIPKNVILSTINFDSGNMVAYHLMLHGWLNFLGISVFKARLLSALFAVLTVLFTFLIIKKLTGNPSVAFIACIILSIHPLLLHHSHMARGYAASLCFATAASYIVLCITDSTGNFRKRILLYLGFALLAVLAVLSHYLSVALFVFLAAWLITNKSFFRQHLFPAALALLVTSSIIFLWMQNGGSEGLQEMRKIDEWYLKNTSAQVHTSTRSLIEGAVQQLLAIFGNYGQYLGFRLRSFAFLLAFPIAATLISLNCFNNPTRRRAINFLAGAIISVVLFSALLAIKSGHTTSFNARYGIYAIPFACALLAVALHAALFNSMSVLKKFVLNISLVITLAIFIISAIPAYSGIALTYYHSPKLHNDVINFKLDKYYLKEHYEPLAEKIEHIYARGDTIIYSDWNTAQVINLFLHNSDKDIVQKVTPGLEKKILLYESASFSYNVIPETEK